MNTDVSEIRIKIPADAYAIWARAAARNHVSVTAFVKMTVTSALERTGDIAIPKSVTEVKKEKPAPEVKLTSREQWLRDEEDEYVPALYDFEPLPDPDAVFKAPLT